MKVTELLNELFNEMNRLNELRSKTKPNPKILKRMRELNEAYEIAHEFGVQKAQKA